MRKGKSKVMLVSPVLSDQPESVIEQFPQGVAAVDNVNLGKSLFHIIMFCDKVGLMDKVVLYRDTELRPSVGDFLDVRYGLRRGKQGDRLLQIIDVKESARRDERLVTDFWGQIRISSRSGDDSQDFGFVDDIYVPKYLLAQGSYSNGDTVSGRAIYADGRDNMCAFELEMDDDDDDEEDE